MTKAVYNRKHLMGHLMTVSEGEFMDKRLGTHRHGSGAVAESILHRQCADREKLGLSWSFETS